MSGIRSFGLRVDLDERNELSQAVGKPLAAQGLNGAEILMLLEAKKKLTDGEREGFGNVVDTYKLNLITKMLSKSCSKEDLATMKDADKINVRMRLLREVNHAFNDACIEIMELFHLRCSMDLRDTIAARGRDIATWKGEEKIVVANSVGQQTLPPAQYMLLGYFDYYLEQEPEVKSRLMTVLYERQDGERAPEAVESIMKHHSLTLEQGYDVSAIRARWRDSQMYAANRVSCGLDDITDPSALVKKLNDIWLHEKESIGEDVRIKKVDAKGEGAGARKDTRGQKVNVCSICLEHAMRLGMDPTSKRDTPLPKPATHECEFPALSISFVAAITRKASRPA